MAAPETGAQPPLVKEGSTNQSVQEVKRVSYASAVQNKPILSKYDYEVTTIDGTSMVEIPEEVFQHSVPLWEDFLEGRFLGDAPHVAKVHVIVNKIWPLGDKNVKIDVFPVSQTTVKFRITDAATRRRIQKRGMWNIADIPMVVTKWAPASEKEDEEPEIKTIPMWITMKNVPHRMFSRKGLGFIASAVGQPVRLHPDTELCTSFEEARIFVEAEVSKGFPKQHRFTSKTGINAVVDFVYPWLPTRCSLCSKWGHKQNVCVMNGGKKLLVQEQQAPEAESGMEKTEAVKENTEDTNEIEVTGEMVVQSPLVLGAEEPSTVIKDSGEHQDKISEEITTEESKIPEEGDWLKAKSPGKKSRVETETSSITSPSRYAALEDTEDGPDDHDENDSEEGEIPQEPSEKVGNQRGSSLRPPLHRQTKGTNKYLSESFALDTKAPKPNVSSKKKSRK